MSVSSLNQTKKSRRKAMSVMMVPQIVVLGNCWSTRSHAPAAKKTYY